MHLSSLSHVDATRHTVTHRKQETAIANQRCSLHPLRLGLVNCLPFSHLFIVSVVKKTEEGNFYSLLVSWGNEVHWWVENAGQALSQALPAPRSPCGSCAVPWWRLLLVRRVWTLMCQSQKAPSLAHPPNNTFSGSNTSFRTPANQICHVLVTECQ